MIKKNAFTLLELLITLFISALFFALATPTWHQFFSETKSQIILNQLASAVNLARSEAIKRNMTISICKSIDQKSCSGEWSDGQIVFIDPNANGKISSTEQIIAVFHAVSPSDKLTWKSTNSTDYLQINPDGSLNGHPGRFICYSHKKTQSLIISNTGRIRFSDKK